MVAFCGAKPLVSRLTKTINQFFYISVLMDICQWAVICCDTHQLKRGIDMDWRLGLDLGTNSMGWSVLGLDYNDRVDAVIDMGVRIFHDSRDQKTGEPLAVERRMARGTRKNLRRRKQRRRGLFQLLQKENLFPTEKAEAVKLKIRDPYALRIKALDQKLERYELGRALFHLGVRRGFKSNRKDNADEALPVENENELKDAGRDISKMKQGEKCLVLKEAIEKSEHRTIGEFLFHHNKRQRDEKKYRPQVCSGTFPLVSAS